MRCSRRRKRGAPGAREHAPGAGRAAMAFWPPFPSVAAMQSTASVLAATSRDSAAQTVGAVDTSNDASGSAEIAATAADELSKSISEINRQLARASKVVVAAAT